VIIVSWNAKAYLLKCLDSVFRQTTGTSHSTEIIVVDNASTDGSPEAVAANYPSVKLVVNDANYGFARANNIGLRASTGEYLLLVNSDVVVSPDCFSKCIRYLDEHPEIGMLGPRIIGTDGRIQRSCMSYPSIWNALCRALGLDSLFPRSQLFGSYLLTYWNHEDTRDVEVINGCFWIIRRSAMDQVGMLDERFFIYGEDIDWCMRFNASGWKVVFFSEAEALHYGGASSANAPLRFQIEMQRANLQYWKKHHSALQVAAYLAICTLHHSLRIVAEGVAYPLRRDRTTSGYKITRSLASLKWILGAAVGRRESDKV
jgi:GT2 family glycosyltransferase